MSDIDASDVVDTDPPDELDDNDPKDYAVKRWLFENFFRVRNFLKDGVGVSGTFTTADAKTITVTNGIITDISP